MIASDDDRCFELAGCDHFVELEAGFCTLAVTQPAYTCRQTLKLDLFLRHRQPASKMVVVRKKIHDRVVSFVNVLAIARQCDPAKRPFALAKKRTNIRGYETRIIERIRNAVVEGSLSEIIAVIEND